MLLKTALLFGNFDRLCQSLTKHQDASFALVVSDLLPEVVTFEVHRNLRRDRTQSETLLIDNIGDALRFVARLDKPGADLCPNDLLELRKRVTGKSNVGFRTQPQAARGDHVPIEPAGIPGAVARLFDWLLSPAFSQMHPIEQMTVCQARLFEIVPFPAMSETIGACFSYLLLRCRLRLLPLFEPHELVEMDAAMEDAFRLDTRPLLELNLRACTRACNFLIERLEASG